MDENCDQKNSPPLIQRVNHSEGCLSPALDYISQKSFQWDLPPPRLSPLKEAAARLARKRLTAIENWRLPACRGRRDVFLGPWAAWARCSRRCLASSWLKWRRSPRPSGSARYWDRSYPLRWRGASGLSERKTGKSQAKNRILIFPDLRGS